MSSTIDLIMDIEYQYSAGIHTVGNCATEGCTQHSRGCVYCRACAEKRLAERVGAVKAGELARLFHKRMNTQGAIDDFIEDIAND